MNQKDYLVDELSKAGLTGKRGEPGDPKWVRIWVRDCCRCVYCGEYLLKDVIRMHSAQIDHLLPRSLYPEHADSEDNLVLSCFCCNQIKRDFDPLKERRDLANSPLEAHRDLIIELCRKRIMLDLTIKQRILEKSRAVAK